MRTTMTSTTYTHGMNEDNSITYLTTTQLNHHHHFTSQAANETPNKIDATPPPLTSPPPLAVAMLGPGMGYAIAQLHNVSTHVCGRTHVVTHPMWTHT